MSETNRSSSKIRPLAIAGLVAASLLLGATASAAETTEAVPSQLSLTQQVAPISFNDDQGDDEDDDVFDETIEFLEDILDWLI